MDLASLIAADFARLLQYGGASILFGTALFNLISLPRSGEAAAAAQAWPKPLFLGAGMTLVAGAVLSLLAQSATMNDVSLTRLNLDEVKTVLLDMQWGHAIAVRILLGLCAVIIAFGQPRPAVFTWLAGLGAISLASFAFTGHGVADDGLIGIIHLGSDMIHSFAAGVWIGALVGFFILLARAPTLQDPNRTILVAALTGFANTGTTMVAVLAVTGLINSYFLIGFAGLPRIFSSVYGDLLAVKVVLFVVMLGLAANNRFRLTPALAAASDPSSRTSAILALRQSVTLEVGAGITILALVAAFGMMEPPAVS